MHFVVEGTVSESNLMYKNCLNYSQETDSHDFLVLLISTAHSLLVPCCSDKDEEEQGKFSLPQCDVILKCGFK